MHTYNTCIHTVLEMAAGHQPFSDQFQHMANQNCFWSAKLQYIFSGRAINILQKFYLQKNSWPISDSYSYHCTYMHTHKYIHAYICCSYIPLRVGYHYYYTSLRQSWGWVLITQWYHTNALLKIFRGFNFPHVSPMTKIFNIDFFLNYGTYMHTYTCAPVHIGVHICIHQTSGSESGPTKVELTYAHSEKRLPWVFIRNNKASNYPPLKPALPHWYLLVNSLY